GKPGVDYRWTARAVRLPLPAEDLRELQGRWDVAGMTPCNNKNVKLPDELRLGEPGPAFEISGNQLLRGGQLVATLANDVAHDALNKEKGFPYSRLLMLTLPDGRGLLCNYSIGQDGVEIAYPHTTSCHRGSGQIIYLKRAVP